jgi:hypothetical protein
VSVVAAIAFSDRSIELMARRSSRPAHPAFQAPRKEIRKDEESMAPHSSSTTVPVPHEAAPSTLGVPVALRSAGTWWLVATALFSLLVYYLVGVDQGAVSVFGDDLHVHEFLHDGRHVLAFPCH